MTMLLYWMILGFSVGMLLNGIVNIVQKRWVSAYMSFGLAGFAFAASAVVHQGL